MEWVALDKGTFSLKTLEDGLWFPTAMTGLRGWAKRTGLTQSHYHVPFFPSLERQTKLAPEPVG